MFMSWILKMFLGILGKYLAVALSGPIQNELARLLPIATRYVARVDGGERSSEAKREAVQEGIVAEVRGIPGLNPAMSVINFAIELAYQHFMKTRGK